MFVYVYNFIVLSVGRQARARANRQNIPQNPPNIPQNPPPNIDPPPVAPSVPTEPTGTQDNIIGRIQENKIVIENLIQTIRQNHATNPSRMTLANTLQTLIGEVESATNQIHRWNTFRSDCRRWYADKLSHVAVKDKKIGKDLICALFIDPRTNAPYSYLQTVPNPLVPR